ncbi:MAG: hypothetical protein DMF23_00850 [Verrucomicrobia bacterium]|nr:MAG: hypothetical protein DMF23_00850 [Verrucomicrobiota bacterium]
MKIGSQELATHRRRIFGLRWQAQRDTALLSFASRAFAHQPDAQYARGHTATGKVPSSLRFACAVQKIWQKISKVQSFKQSEYDN